MDDAKRPHLAWLTWVAIGFAIPVLYVLSVGPVALVFELSDPPTWASDSAEKFYAPLIRASESNPTVEYVLSCYMVPFVWLRDATVGKP